ncbi:MAG TPA: DoxX family protein [Vicinamibacterales bacterium]|nr:DoxX family protein [Vicinamibacterales bacterium]
MRFNKTLWAIQGVLALLFVFAGGMKLALPAEALAGPVALPGWFMRFIGVAELLGGLGLVLPGAFRIHTELTPIAAAGLVIIMTGAVVVSVVGMGVAAAVVPLVVGALAGVVAYARLPLASVAPSF